MGVASVPCRGPTGCTAEFLDARCGDSKGRLGDACSADNKEMLSCEKGKFTRVAVCAGPQQCSVSTQIKKPLVGELTMRNYETVTKFACDGPRSEVGVTCSERWFVCSIDGKYSLACLNGKYVRAGTAEV